jgi:bifunctional non-homologous end joining protein LigD
VACTSSFGIVIPSSIGDEVEFYAFDTLVSDGEDVRKLPLSMRKANLARLLARRVDGIFLSDFEQDEISPDLFRHACLLGLEGMVSKHRERPYRAGRSPHWIKVKNRSAHPAAPDLPRDVFQKIR